MKAGGCAMLLAAALLFSAEKIRAETERIKTLSEMIRLLTLMRRELALNMPYLNQLAVLACDNAEGECRCFFEALCKGMADNMCFSELWKTEAGRCLPSLTERDLIPLSNLSTSLGRYELSQQLSALECCIDELSQNRKECGEKHRQEQKLNYALPLSAAVMLIIMII